jgi:hypothetical protein
LDQNSLANSIIAYVNTIYQGRDGLDTPGTEAEGRISYHLGLEQASAAFREANAGADCDTLILCEIFFLQQELQFCHPDDKNAIGSLTQAIHDFDDSLNCLSIVADNAVYKKAALTHSTTPKNMVNGCPNDIFHQTCRSHITRLRNVLRSPGINMAEKALLEQRIDNIKTAEAVYTKLQIAAMA